MIVFVFHLFLLCVIKLVTCGCLKCGPYHWVLRFAKCVHVLLCGECFPRNEITRN